MNRPLALFARRGIVVLGLLAVVALGAITVRAAAAWTAASAPLPEPPVSVEAIASQLAAEQARSADLQARLDEMAARAMELASALGAANDQVAADTATADDLRGQLAAAKKALARVERQVASANARLRQAAAAPVTTGAQSAGGEHDGDDEHEGGDEHDDD